jgi:Pyruvate/2-oxoacid:ferredoxin oxidoreductase delta subunit
VVDVSIDQGKVVALIVDMFLFVIRQLPNPLNAIKRCFVGHLAGKDLYRKLGRKIDGLTARAPWNDTLFAILKELYTPDEAELVVKMPYGLSTLDQIEASAHFSHARLVSILDSLCEKGLVLDIWADEKYHYAVSPFIIGIFEFTMMRTRGELNTREWARLFHTYLQDSATYYRANLSKGQTISPLRTLPHEDALDDSAHVEILDYEKAGSIIEGARTMGIGICSCRHEKLHAGAKQCDIPLETCSSFDDAAETLIRHGLAREVSREEMRDNLARSREQGLVLCADNVRNDVSFICHCCGCCCNVLLGISRFGYPNTVVTSNYRAQIDVATCLQCRTCVETCPVNAIAPGGNSGFPSINESVCLGCGVCALRCLSESLKLVRRDKRVYYPEDTFERVILQSLDQGTLQNLLFSNPSKISHAFLRGFVGGFLKLPPVKRALLGDHLRSRFLNALRRSSS